MKQFLLFAGRESANLKGVQGFVGDFDSFSEAFVALVDRQVPSEWWHVLDTKTGEVVERQHLKVHNGMVGFERSHWMAGQPPKVEPVVTATPAPVISVSLPKAPDLSALEADLRSAVVTGSKNGHANGSVNGKANGHANGAAADH
jgi:hypothetical protein